MVPVAAGPFVMGTDLERADAQDKPQHKVTLAAFYLDKYLVSNAQYARFAAATNRRPPLNWKDGRIPQGELMNPVTMVTWDDAAAYAEWGGQRARDRDPRARGAIGATGLSFAARPRCGGQSAQAKHRSSPIFPHQPGCRPGDRQTRSEEHTSEI